MSKNDSVTIEGVGNEDAVIEKAIAELCRVKPVDIHVASTTVVDELELQLKRYVKMVIAMKTF